jgi:Prenyltransferase and squalene oxidase repeat
MHTQRTSKSRSPVLGALRPIAAVALLATLALAPQAGAHVTDQQAQAAADAAVAWLDTQQDAATGELAGFGGDWTMVALANAGVNAADFRATALDPSVQDYFHQSWDWLGPGELATDHERAILAGQAGGIQTAKVSASRNLVAGLTTFFDGSQLGSPSLVNDDIFGLLALEHAGPAGAISPTLASLVRSKQTTKAPGEAGWNFAGQPGQDPDVDMTGAGIAALCAAGADASDPTVAKAVDWLETKQDDATGGIASSFFGPNADSTAWVVNGLRQCGVDPQGPEWTTATGKTPLDFLLALQQPSGAFVWALGDSFDNLYATQEAVTALVGDGFGAEPPVREEPSDPRLRPAPAVAAGTAVPLALVLDHGSERPGAERACSVTAPTGATVAEVLELAAVATTPAYCVTQLELTGDDGSERLRGVNGAIAAADARWVASVDGGPAKAELTDAVALGSTVVVKLDGDAAGAPVLPPLDASAPQPRTAKAVLARGRRLAMGRRGAVRVAVRCPRGLGGSGCQGVLRVKYRNRRRWVTAGSLTFAVRSGSRRVVKVHLGRTLRRLASRRGGRRVRIEAVVRDHASGAVSVTRVGALVERR